jgi:hypothetical protein
MDSAGNFVITWSSWSGQDGDEAGIFGQRLSNLSFPIGGEFQVNATTTGVQSFSDIVVDSAGNFVVVWESPDASYDGVFARSFLADGTPLSDEFQVNSYTTFDQDDATVALTSTGYVVAWSETASGRIGVRTVEIDGGNGIPTLGTEMYVAGDGRTTRPAIDTAADGSFVLAYQDADDGLFDLGVGAQRFDSSGTPIGTPFRVNAYTTGSQQTPSVAVKPNGDFIVVWADLHNRQIRQRRYAADGTPQADERKAGVLDGTFDLRFPSVVANDDGTFFIIWETFNEQMQGGDFSGSGIAGRLFATNGNPIGPKIRVNDDVVSSQRNPALAGDGNHNYIVSWDQSSGQDGDGNSVEARLFGPPLSLSTTTTTSSTTTTTVSTTTTTLPADSCGDVNGDGRITASDALAALFAAVGTIICDPCLCDTDGSGVITATDALRILQAAVGQPVALNCQAC